MSRVTGAISSTVVTLSRKAETTAVTTEKMAIILKGSPFATFALLIAMYSNTPVGFMMLMITIMLIIRKTTFQSTPRSME